MQVKDIQRKNFQDRYLKKHVVAALKSVHLPGDVTFRCRKCNVEACQAHDIRTIKESHHVVINRDFRDSKVKSCPILQFFENLQDLALFCAFNSTQTLTFKTYTVNHNYERIEQTNYGRLFPEWSGKMIDSSEKSMLPLIRQSSCVIVSLSWRGALK